jgi:hypothetical protein
MDYKSTRDLLCLTQLQMAELLSEDLNEYRKNERAVNRKSEETKRIYTYSSQYEYLREWTYKNEQDDYDIPYKKLKPNFIKDILKKIGDAEMIILNCDLSIEKSKSEIPEINKQLESFFHLNKCLPESEILMRRKLAEQLDKCIDVMGRKELRLRTLELKRRWARADVDFLKEYLVEISKTVDITALGYTMP